MRAFVVVKRRQKRRRKRHSQPTRANVDLFGTHGCSTHTILWVEQFELHTRAERLARVVLKRERELGLLIVKRDLRVVFVDAQRRIISCNEAHERERTHCQTE